MSQVRGSNRTPIHTGCRAEEINMNNNNNNINDDDNDHNNDNDDDNNDINNNKNNDGDGDDDFFYATNSFTLLIGIVVPVNFLPEKDGGQRFFKEQISYEHQYDSRWGKNYPIRSTVR